MAEAKKQNKGGRGVYCCVVGCSSSTGRRGDLKFFNVRRKNDELTKSWTKAINRKNRDDSLWQPNSASIICSRHFISQRPSADPKSPDFAPSLFMTGSKADCEEQRKRKAEQSLSRYERVSDYFYYNF